jgi:tRNA(Arg) A34 adenosine deaminase TadA
MRVEKPNFMAIALEEAEAAAQRGEVPVGAVIVDDAGEILARTGNRVLEDKDPTAHAEILAIREAARVLGSERLANCALYVTLEPCPMCAAAISMARIARLYYGAEDEKSGGVDHGPRIYASRAAHHKPEVYGGINASGASRLLKSFFAQRR